MAETNPDDYEVITCPTLRNLGYQLSNGTISPSSEREYLIHIEGQIQGTFADDSPGVSYFPFDHGERVGTQKLRDGIALLEQFLRRGWNCQKAFVQDHGITDNALCFFIPSSTKLQNRGPQGEFVIEKPVVEPYSSDSDLTLFLLHNSAGSRLGNKFRRLSGKYVPKIRKV